MCACCKCNEARASTTTHVVDYNGHLIIIRNVPCKECVQCGDKVYSNDVTIRLEELVNHTKTLIHEISIIDYATAA